MLLLVNIAEIVSILLIVFNAAPLVVLVLPINCEFVIDIICAPTSFTIATLLFLKITLSIVADAFDPLKQIAFIPFWMVIFETFKTVLPANLKPLWESPDTLSAKSIIDNDLSCPCI